MHNISVSFRGRSKQVSVKPPEWCPHGGRNTSPTVISTSNSDNSSSSDKVGYFARTYRCSYSDCKKYFVIEYAYDFESQSSSILEYSYRPPIKVDLPQNIEKISPMFVEIYGQSTIAEIEKLEQVAGVGYRKSAEFLIKDYAIRKNSTLEDTIKTQPLGQVISNHLKDFPKIQTLAKAIAWIGNDETHYIRKHDEKDIQDLKKFILATSQFIAADYDVDEALDFTSSN